MLQVWRCKYCNQRQKHHQVMRHFEFGKEPICSRGGTKSRVVQGFVTGQSGRICIEKANRASPGRRSLYDKERGPNSRRSSPARAGHSRTHQRFHGRGTRQLQSASLYKNIRRTFWMGDAKHALIFPCLFDPCGSP